MSKETKIEWADSTVNFWSGCTKVSAGCAHCYAEGLSKRNLGNIGEWGKGAARKRHQSAFKLAFQLNKQPWICDECGMAHAVPGQICMTKDCQCETRHRRRVFSLSLGDWLDPEVPIEWLAEMLDTIRRCDQLQWLLVTKRPELWKSRMEQVVVMETISDDLFQWVRLWLWQLKDGNGDTPSHIMVLTSVEDQKAADERIPALLKIPAAQRGLSCEPLLGPVDIQAALNKMPFQIGGGEAGLHWVIVGGESGPGARACNVDWLFDIKDQCAEAGVPCFIKQFGAAPVYTAAGVNSAIKRHWNDPSWFISWNSDHNAAPKITYKKGGDITEWPHELRVREFPEVL